jgi:hypothetical protein
MTWRAMAATSDNVASDGGDGRSTREAEWKEREAEARAAAAVVGRCRLTLSNPALKAPTISALETNIW